VKCFVNKEQRNEQFVFTSVGQILSMQAHYRIKAFRNEDTTIIILIRKHSGTLKRSQVELILCVLRKMYF